MYRNVLTCSIMALTLLVGTSGTASAADNSGNPAILKAVNNLQTSVNVLQSSINNVQMTVGALDALQSSVNNLQTTINNVQTSINALGAAALSNVRMTPGLFMDFDQAILFSVTNVSSVAHTIRVEVLDSLGNLTPIGGAEGVVLQPGKSFDGSTPASIGSYSMKYTVLDGTRADIRGSAQQLLASHVVGAALAAE